MKLFSTLPTLAAIFLPLVSSQTIVDFLADDPDNFSILLDLVEAAGLVETLSGEDLYTVFAPTNEAFTNTIDPATLEFLQNPDNREDLVDVLTYHVVEGVVGAQDLADLEEGEGITAVNGDVLDVAVEPDRITINGATIQEADFEVDNGLVHVIDAVLVPASDDPAQPSTDSNPDQSSETDKTIVDIAVEDPENFSTLVDLLTRAGLVETLSSEGPFTVFAPTNEAFDAAFDQATLEGLYDDPDGLADILLYHVVDDKLLSSDLEEGFVPTLSGEDLTITITFEDVGEDEQGSIMVNDANVIIPDVEGSNGVIHVIDKVLLI